MTAVSSFYSCDRLPSTWWVTLENLTSVEEPWSTQLVRTEEAYILESQRIIGQI